MNDTHDMPDMPPHIEVRLVSDPIYLSGARELVSSVARRLGFDDLQCSKIALAVDEALCNIIRHGYDRAPDKPIWIRLWPASAGPDGKPRGIRLQLDDEAKQVEPEQLKSRDLDDVRPGGLGVHIIQEVMDEVVYEKRQTTGMRLTMTKHAPQAGGVANATAKGKACGCQQAGSKPQGEEAV
jgi:anti-sigma regulatory factor (Ser/Thr protein kinase)